RLLINVKRARLSERLDTVWTDVTCVWAIVFQRLGTDTLNPNDGLRRGRFIPSPAPLPFPHRMTFSDGEPLTSQMGLDRAKWRQQRGMFDAWQLEYTVRGHSHNGHLYQVDTIPTVHDTVNGVEGKCYVSAVKYMRSIQNGTETMVTVRKPNLLAAG